MIPQTDNQTAYIKYESSKGDQISLLICVMYIDILISTLIV